jgi:hypothetical protein
MNFATILMALGGAFALMASRAQAMPTAPVQPGAAPKLPAAGRSALDAARALEQYLSAGGSQGTKSAPSEQVRRAQADMGGTKADGIVGPATRTRAEALGVLLPPRTLEMTRTAPSSAPSSSAAPKPAAPKPAPPAKPSKPAVKSAPAPTAKAALASIKAPPKPAPKPAAPAKPSKPAVKSAPAPKPAVKAAAPKPAAVKAPAKPAAKPAAVVKAPAKRAPVQAARDLLTYLQTRGANYGTKNAPSGPVRDAQRDMGGVAADGIYGPSTRARGAALGVKLPARA